MIIVTVKATPKAAHKLDFLRAFEEVSAFVYQEAGCVEYEIYQKNETSSELFIFERWESQEALEAHLVTQHMKDFFERTGSWFDSDNDMRTYQIR